MKLAAGIAAVALSAQCAMAQNYPVKDSGAKLD
jgi:hypothetical protein